MDTMTLTKIGAGLFSAWLVLLLGQWAGEEIYHADAHGEQSYVIEVAEAAEAEPEEQIDIVALIAAADPADGEKVFRKCSACHKVNGEDGVGPHLNGAMGRDIASVAGFGYSSALQAIDGVWNEQEMSDFIENPKGFAPGTAMGFAGLKKPQDRADVIAYLESTGG